ncbi:ABC transporter ATP-binding protein [Peptoniphilus equinus]|uniref:ABC transporter ATP-binding protein n=1 Tax=Peptoniphilus equinus TaxID=3016343 RepID=A0ABY7QVI4_9FIRM|nr:ABC transporter ATP-binding protein [Peptoniphilus equinus]WBW49918.1 ABC transporter ATP-binding protein [Peptoniphilus equinus]
MASIELRNVSKQFKDMYAIKHIDLTIEDGSFTVLVGPSGCGKSTTLRMIAGLERQSEGDIYINDRLVNDVSAADRGVAMVFQNYALYPTMTVRQNIEFGLINNKVEKAKRNALIEEISEIVSLDGYMDRMPSELSGGQRQRVALARAMVKKPDVFILDEPLSNLDAKLRVKMRLELIKLHQKLQTTFIYVTHDQIEAMSMGTKIVLMNEGKIMQESTPAEMYDFPENLFSAQFIGSPPMNIRTIDQVGPLFETMDPDVAYMGFRPEGAHLTKVYSHKDAVQFSGYIESAEVLGSEIIYSLCGGSGELIFVKSFDKKHTLNGNVWVEIPRENLVFFNANGDVIKREVHNTLREDRYDKAQ